MLKPFFKLLNVLSERIGSNVAGMMALLLSKLPKYTVASLVNMFINLGCFIKFNEANIELFFKNIHEIQK